MQRGLAVTTSISIFRNRKAQDIKMGETIMILFIFMVLLMVGLTFFVRYQRSNVTSIRSEQTIKKSVQIAQIFSVLPEVVCSFENVKKENCVDILKLDSAAKTITGHQTYYFPYFKYSEIIVYEVYPGEKEWVLYNNSIPKTTKLSTPIPLALYDATEKSYHYGYMEVNYYEPKRTLG
jgi:heme/copper-type cytochrome/quinol oxidase subunit 2